MIELILNCVGVALGLAGTALNVSTSYRVKDRAFKLWLASDIFLVAWSALSSNYPMLTLYGVYSAFAVASILNNRNAIR